MDSLCQIFHETKDSSLIDSIISDFRSVHKGILAAGNAWEGPMTKDHAKTNFLVFLVRKKLEKGETRPLCMKKEQRDIEKELGYRNF